MKKLKRIAVGLLIVAMCSQSFAAVVSDNDGSAFITKAEFDSLKNNFQAQIDNYNSSIDSKIDGAIATYLSGIRISKTENRSIYSRDSSVYCMDYDNRLKYKLGVPYIYGATGWYSDRPSGSTYASSGYRFQARGFTLTGNPQNGEPGSPNSFHKLLINNIDYTKGTAAWVGYSEDCQEIMPLSVYFEPHKDIQSSGGNLTNAPITYIEIGPRTAETAKAYVTTGYKECDTSMSFGNIHYQGSTSTNNATWSWNNPSVQYSNPQYTNMIVPYSATNYEFNHASIYTQTAFARYTSTIGSSQPLYYFRSEPTDMLDGFLASEATKRDWWEKAFGDGELEFAYYQYHVPYDNTDPSKISEANYYRLVATRSSLTYEPFGTRSSGKFEAPIVQCFETKYIRHFNRIFNPNYDDLAKYYTSTAPYNTKTYDSFLENNGKKHVALAAGFPLVEVKKDEVIQYSLNFKDSGEYLVWAKLEPFNIDTKPQDEAVSKPSEFLKIGGGTWDNTKKCVKVNQHSTISFDEIPNDGYIWIKWSKNSASINGGGEILLSPTVQVTLPVD